MSYNESITLIKDGENSLRKISMIRREVSLLSSISLFNFYLK